VRDFYRDRYLSELQGSYNSEDEATFSTRVGLALSRLGGESRQVLDLGCGSGGASARLAAAGHSVVGVDISSTGIAVARARAPQVVFELVEAGAPFPFDDARFDACFCSEVLEHILDVEAAVREVHRVLISGGLFLLTVPYHGLVKNLGIACVSFERHFDPSGEHIRFFTRRSLSSLLARNGFTVEHFAGVGRFWPVWKSMFIVAAKR
jgi:2-polyprenyl-6-hydroxyphenyl methylase/3-demethylubiquinone-9 3-methyltransferase